MPTYRGIEKNEILKSIQQGLDLLEELKIGSATGKLCHEWLNASPLAKIEAATTDEALVAALYQEIGQLKMEMDWLKKSQAGALRRRGR